jgi:geranylgeranyl reductase family protein
MSNIYDVAIIGAGPAGTSCAYNLKRFHPDLSVLLIDKMHFPRYKTCGGGISPEVANYLDFDLSAAIDYHCSEAIMVANGKSISSPSFPIWMTRREVFDNFLLKKAQLQGVEVLTQCDVADINDYQHRPHIQTSQGSLASKIVILAEGGRGKLARKLPIKKNNVLAAMEYEFYTSQLSGKLYIDFDQLDNGYAWNFPKSDGLSLGIGGHIKGKDKKNVGLPEKLVHYVKQFGVNHYDSEHLHGHPIQIYSGRKKLVHGRLILIGEIAGCVDPLTAEGIRPAIKSGYLAAKVVANAFYQKKLALVSQYDRLFHQQIGRDFQYARVFSYFLNNHMSKVLPYLNTTFAVNEFLGIFSGQATYRSSVTPRRIIKLLAKIWRRK